MHRDEFKIRKHVPNYKNNPPGNPDPEPEDIYDCVDLMVFLLYDIPYRVVYGDLKTFLKALQENAEDLPEEWKIQRKLLLTMIANILAMPKTATDFELRLFFEEEVDQNHPYYPVLKEFQDMGDASGGEIICMPYLRIQDNKKFVKDKDMDYHIEWIGPFTLHQLFSTPKRALAPDVLKAIAKARTFGIFSESHRTGQPFQILDHRIKKPGTQLVTGGNNNRKCASSGTDCVYNTGTWCNLDASGHCSAMTP